MTLAMSGNISPSTSPTGVAMFKAWLASWRDWEMNPILLKELRQAMRSQFLIRLLGLLLAILFLVSLLLLMRHDLIWSRAQPKQIGMHLFEAFLMILTVISVLFVPLYVGIRLAMERREHDLDLIFVTTLGAGQIVRGKLFCGAYLALMIFSMCAPFMAFTSLLRGVDLPTIFFILFCLFAVVCLAIQAAILFACLPFNWFFKTLTGLLFTAGLAVLSGGLILFSCRMLQTGVGTMLGKLHFWIGFGMTMLLIACGIRLLQVMSVSLIIADNRPRGYFNEVIKTETATLTRSVPEP